MLCGLPAALVRGGRDRAGVGGSFSLEGDTFRVDGSSWGASINGVSESVPLGLTAIRGYRRSA